LKTANLCVGKSAWNHAVSLPKQAAQTHAFFK